MKNHGARAEPTTTPAEWRRGLRGNKIRSLEIFREIPRGTAPSNPVIPGTNRRKLNCRGQSRLHNPRVARPTHMAWATVNRNFWKLVRRCPSRGEYRVNHVGPGNFSGGRGGHTRPNDRQMAVAQPGSGTRVWIAERREVQGGTPHWIIAARLGRDGAQRQIPGDVLKALQDRLS